MLKTYLSWLLSGLLSGLLLIGLCALPATASAKGTQQPTVEQVKIKVARLGVGAKAKATVWLANGTKIKGYVAQAGDADFVMRDRKTDAPTTIRYADVAKIESNKGHSMARNVAIGVAVGVGAVLAVLGLLIASLD